MKEMSSKPTSLEKKLTNHSARKNLVQKLRDENVPPPNGYYANQRTQKCSVSSQLQFNYRKTTENILTSSQQ